MILNVEEIYSHSKIDGNISLENNGDITFYYHLSLPEVYSLSREDFDLITTEKFKFYKLLPENTIVHFQHIYLKTRYQANDLPNSTFLQKATYRKFKNRDFISHTCYMYITLTHLKSLDSRYLGSSFKKTRNIFKEDRVRIENFRKSVEQAISLLNNSAYFLATPLEDYEIHEISFNYLTGFKNKLTDIQFKPDFKIGNDYYNIYAINKLENQPEIIKNCVVDRKMSVDDYTFFKSPLQHLGLELQCNHIVNNLVYIDGHNDIKSILNKRRNDFNTFSALSRENKVSFEDIDQYLDAVEKNDTVRLCRNHFNLVVWGDREELNDIDKKIVSTFSDVDIVPYNATYVDHIYYYLSCIPGNSGNLPMQETFFSEIEKSTCYDINVTNYKSDSKGIILNDRISQIPVTIDDFYEPYDKKIITARNAFLIAETGGGKSFFLNHLYRQYIEQDFSLVLIDLGGSFEKLAKLYHEKTAYIKFEEGKPLGINPFLILSQEDLTADKYRTLSDFIFILWKKNKEPDDNERVSMKKILQDYYSNFTGNYDFPSFYYYIKDSAGLLGKLEIQPEFFDIDSFVHVCSEFSHGGIYEYLLKDDSQNHYLADKQFIVFELDNIRDNIDILPIVFMSIRDTIENVVWKKRKADKRVWFEEAAKLFKHTEILKSIEYYFQTIRKHDGSVGIVLQSLNQLPKNEIGESILDNTQIFYVLQPKNFDTYRERLHFTQHDIYLLNSVRSNFESDKPYTEVFLKLGKRPSNVYRLEVPREAILAYLSEGKEKEKIMAEYHRVGNMETAIMNLVKLKNYEN